jgi:hypothetical protein
MNGVMIIKLFFNTYNREDRCKMLISKETMEVSEDSY